MGACHSTKAEVPPKVIRASSTSLSKRSVDDPKPKKSKAPVPSKFRTLLEGVMEGKEMKTIKTAYKEGRTPSDHDVAAFREKVRSTARTAYLRRDTLIESCQESLNDLVKKYDEGNWDELLDDARDFSGYKGKRDQPRNLEESKEKVLNNLETSVDELRKAQEVHSRTMDKMLGFYIAGRELADLAYMVGDTTIRGKRFLPLTIVREVANVASEVMQAKIDQESEEDRDMEVMISTAEQLADRIQKGDETEDMKEDAEPHESKRSEPTTVPEPASVQVSDIELTVVVEPVQEPVALTTSLDVTSIKEPEPTPVVN